MNEGTDERSMDGILRGCADEIAAVISEDEFLAEGDGVTVLVEDRGDWRFKLANEIARLKGVAVLVAITGFNRRPNSGRRLEGTLHIEVTCIENPVLNRRSQNAITAQRAAERLARLLHWRRLGKDGFDNPLLLTDIGRNDDNMANIEVLRFETEQSLDLEAMCND